MPQYAHAEGFVGDQAGEPVVLGGFEDVGRGGSVDRQIPAAVRPREQHLRLRAAEREPDVSIDAQRFARQPAKTVPDVLCVDRLETGVVGGRGLSFGHHREGAGYVAPDRGQQRQVVVGVDAETLGDERPDGLSFGEQPLDERNRAAHSDVGLVRRRKVEA